MTSIRSQSKLIYTSRTDNDSDLVGQVSESLRDGQIVVIPTDTVYGLAAAIDQPDAISRLYALKNRPPEKAIPVLLSDASQLHRVAAELPAAASRLASCFWPGAVTLVLPALPHLPSPVTSTSENGRRTVAVRVPDNPLAQSIIAASGGALAVTSANRSGQQPALDAAEVALLAEFGPLLVVDGGRVSGGIPSTVVLATEAEPVILRQGAVSADAIFEALRNRAGERGDPTCQGYDQPPTGRDRHTGAAKLST